MSNTTQANKLFLSLAEKVNRLKSLDELVTTSRISTYHMPASPFYRTNGHAAIRVKTLTLRHTHLFGKVESPKLLLFDSPENAAITIGRIIKNKGKYTFQLPRFHTGVPAQYDLEIAVTQMLAAPQLKKYFTSQHLEAELFVASLIREGHLTFVQQAIYAQTGKSIPLTLVHVRHVKDRRHASDLNRLAEVCSVNLEGLQPQKVKTVLISDNIASGIQVGVTLQTMLDTIQTAGGHVETVIVVAPLLTLYSAVVLSALLARYKTQAVFLVAEGLLTHRDTERYYSPLTANPQLVVDPTLMRLHHLAHPQEIQHEACVRCNWTASFLAPQQALSDSENELQTLRSSNEALFQAQANMSESLIRKNVAKLSPFSSRMLLL